MANISRDSMNVSSTITQVIDQPAETERVVHFTVSPNPPPSQAESNRYLPLIGRLRAIVAQFHEMNDDLSKRLRELGEQVLDIVDNRRFTSLAHAEEIARSRIRRLARDILINPLDDSPLQEPVMDRDGRDDRDVWERRMRDDYIALAHQFQGDPALSPLDGLPMSAEAQIHLFADAMIQWMHEVSPEEFLALALPNESHVEQKTFAQEPDQTRYATYCGLAQQAAIRKRFKKIQERMAGLALVSQQQAGERTERSQQQEQKTREAAEAHEAALRQQIDALRHQYEESLAALSTQLTFMKEQYQKIIVTLETRLDSSDQDTKMLVQSLKDQITALHAGQQEGVAKLRKLVETLTLDRQEEVTRLNESLAATAKVSSESLADISATHTRTVGSLKAQIRELATQISNLRTELAKAENENSDNSLQITGLRSQLASALNCIQGLQQEVANMGDSSCIIQ